jgi:hypothetical protein
MLLSLAGLSFVLNMQTEDRAARVQGRQLQLELGPAVFHAGDKLCEYAVLATDVD